MLIAAAEARLSPAGPDEELTRAAELDRALIRRDQRMAARSALDMPAAAGQPEAGALSELRQLLTQMSDDDTAFLLEMARKLAGRDIRT